MTDYSQFPEYREGYDANNRGSSVDRNPYPWTNREWWRNEAWEKGWKAAQYDDDDDDWDDD